jgi:hypothetical protein
MLLFIPSIFIAKDEESDATVAYTLWIDAAKEEELVVTLVLILPKLDENDEEFKFIAAESEDDALVTDEFIDVITCAAEAELLFIFA